MKLPNILTLSRFGFAALLLFLLVTPFPYAKTAALIVFAIAGFTDYLDGYLARNVHGITSFGKLMDPLADKVLVSAAFISFVEIRLTNDFTMEFPQDFANQPLVPAFLVVIIISREFLVTGLRLLAAGEGQVISAGKWGKHKTVWQIVAIVIMLLGLAIRSDLLPLLSLSEQLRYNFDFVFHWTALVVTVAVSVITVISGAKYFAEHKNLITQNV